MEQTPRDRVLHNLRAIDELVDESLRIVGVEGEPEVGEEVNEQPPSEPEPEPAEPEGVSDVVRRGFFAWGLREPVPFVRTVTGDVLVKAGAQLVGIDPETHVLGSGSVRTVHGSMLNPSPKIHGLRQGFDSHMYGKGKQTGDYSFRGSYSNELNLGHAIASGAQVTLQHGDRVVSSISLDEAGARPQIDRAAVLIAVDELPESGKAFRPPVAGPPWLFDIEDVDWSRLPELTAPAALEPGTLEALIDRTDRLYLDHGTNWAGKYMHPAANMEMYGRDISRDLGEALAVVCCAHAESVEVAEKHRRLALNLIQLGIDFAGYAADGSNDWMRAQAGHNNGRKAVALFAAAMLDAEELFTAIRRHPGWSEDDQTFYLPDGTPEWGNDHARRPDKDRRGWFEDPYRRCCTTSALWGHAAMAHSMDLVGRWDHAAFFDYQERYREVEASHGGELLQWGSAFALAVYDQVSGA